MVSGYNMLVSHQDNDVSSLSVNVSILPSRFPRMLGVKVQISIPLEEFLVLSYNNFHSVDHLDLQLNSLEKDLLDSRQTANNLNPIGLVRKTFIDI